MQNSKRTAYQSLATVKFANKITKSSIRNHEIKILKILKFLSTNKSLEKNLFDDALFTKLVLTGFVNVKTVKSFPGEGTHFSYVTVVEINEDGETFLKDFAEQERKARLAAWP